MRNFLPFGLSFFVLKRSAIFSLKLGPRCSERTCTNWPPLLSPINIIMTSDWEGLVLRSSGVHELWGGLRPFCRKDSFHAVRTKLSTRLMGHIAHLRNHIKSINTFEQSSHFIITLSPPVGVNENVVYRQRDTIIDGRQAIRKVRLIFQLRPVK